MIGLFETMRSLDGRVELLDEHLARMARSAAALGMPAPDFSEIPATDEESAVRCFYVEGFVTFTHGPIPDVTLSRRINGRAITLARSFVRELPEHKTTPYTVCANALKHAIASGADEALFVSDEGILEGTSTNVFAVSSDALITAPANILPGIVRNWVVAEAVRMGVRVEERAPTVDELRDGAFLTSSLTLLAPLRVLDGIACKAPGAIFAELRASWERRFPSAR